MREFESFLLQSAPRFETPHPHYNRYLWEMVASGGKRFRPKLLLLVVDACAPLLVRSAFLPALALEVFHTYSLIHDDLPAMDNAALRRGHPTLHQTYDEVSAILAGDALNTYAFYLLSCAHLSSEAQIALIKELALAGGAGGMVMGQAMDCYFEGQALEREVLQLLHLNKTGKLIAASLKMGGIIASIPKEDLQLLEAIGLGIGLLFQVQDDILDATLTPEEAGKTTGQDGLKNSYVNLLGLEGAKGAVCELHEKILIQIEQLRSPVAYPLRRMVESYFS